MHQTAYILLLPNRSWGDVQPKRMTEIPSGTPPGVPKLYTSAKHTKRAGPTRFTALSLQRVFLSHAEQRWTRAYAVLQPQLERHWASFQSRTFRREWCTLKSSAVPPLNEICWAGTSSNRVKANFAQDIDMNASFTDHISITITEKYFMLCSPIKPVKLSKWYTTQFSCFKKIQPWI